MGDTAFRLRLTYRKAGRLRYLSHLEVMRACERAVRRADLPYVVTQGFTPRMKVAFGPALPVGAAGMAESYDLWLRDFVRPAEVLERLRAVSPEDLAPEAAVYVAERERSLSAALTLADYTVEVRGEKVAPDGVRQALDAVLADGALKVQHKGKEKVFDLAMCLPKEMDVEAIDGAVLVRMTTRMGEWGTLRPDVLVNAALERARIDAAYLAVVREGLSREGKDA